MFDGLCIRVDGANGGGPDAGAGNGRARAQRPRSRMTMAVMSTKEWTMRVVDMPDI